MTTLRKIHSHEGFPETHESEVDSEVRRRAGIRLDVHVLAVEQLFHPLDREVFDLVYEFIPSVVSLPWITFSVLVVEHGSHRSENGFAREVLRGYELQTLVYSFRFVFLQPKDFGVHILQIVFPHENTLC